MFLHSILTRRLLNNNSFNNWFAFIYNNINYINAVTTQAAAANIKTTMRPVLTEERESTTFLKTACTFSS